MYLQPLLVLLLGLVSVVHGLNVLLLAADPSRAHIAVWDRLARILAANHNVTVLTLRTQTNGLSYRPSPNVTHYETHFSFKEATEKFEQTIFGRDTPLQVLSLMFTEFHLWTAACEHLLHSAQLAQLQRVPFDVSVVHTSDLCPVLLNHVLGIHNSLVMSVEPMFEHVCQHSASHCTPSYIPTVLSGGSDRQSFGGRLLQSLHWLMFWAAWPVTHWANQNVWLTDHTNNQLNVLSALRQQQRGVLMAGASLLDFPRPLSPSVSYLGVSEPTGSQPLGAEWTRLIQHRGYKGIILLAFGTMAKDALMQQTLAQSYVDALANFPSYLCVAKLNASRFAGQQLPEHIHLSDWIPQAALLAHSRTRLLITHGGINSIQEAAANTVPLLIVPLFVDHYSNARRVQRAVLGLVLHKHEVNQHSLTHNIRVLLQSETFGQRAARYSGMLQRAPAAEAQLLTHAVQRAAKDNRRQFLNETWRTHDLLRYLMLDVYTTIVAASLLLIKSL